MVWRPTACKQKLWPTACEKNFDSGPHFQKVALSRKRSRRNSMQNAPIGIFTALTGTIFVTISMFVSRGNFQATSGPLSSNFRATSGQPLGNFRATFGQP